MCLSPDAEPTEMLIDDLLPSDKKGISFQEPVNESVMAAQSSSDAANPFSTSPTMFSPSLSDPSPANRDHKRSGKGSPGKGPTSPYSIRKAGMRMTRKSTYDDSGRHFFLLKALFTFILFLTLFFS